MVVALVPKMAAALICCPERVRSMDAAKQMSDVRNHLEYLAFLLRRYGEPTVAYTATHYPETQGEWLALRMAMRFDGK